MIDFTLVKQNLEANGFAVTVFKTGKEAAEYLDGQINDKTVAFGGSITLQQIGLYEKLAKHNSVIWHWQLENGMTNQEALHKAQDTEIYISSVNALAQTGEIVNIDGTGNRVSSIFYGHEKVYLVAGANKLSENYHGAILRAQNVAAPKNAQRLKRATPCAVNGDKCYNCNSKERICNCLSVIMKKPGAGLYEVVLVEEALGY